MLKIENLYKIKDKTIHKWNIKRIITQQDKYIIELTNPDKAVWYVNLDRDNMIKDAYRIWTHINGQMETFYIQKWNLNTPKEFLNTLEYFVDKHMRSI
jgi:hypothetical protein